MPKTISFLLILIVLSSCTHPTENKILSNWPKGADKRCKGLYANGETKKATYQFCSIIPYEKEYCYKLGTWKFWDKSGELIAEVQFENQEKTIRGHGGCDIKIIESFISRTSNEISPRYQEKIENCFCPLRILVQK